MQKVKLLSLNLHCLEEKDIEQNQQIIVSEIIKKDIDVIFLQEVAQLHKNTIEEGHIKVGNYGYVLQSMLKVLGYDYFYHFEPIKHSFGKYDEGVAILSKHNIKDLKTGYISYTKDYYDWRSRKYIKGTVMFGKEFFDLYSVHLGWNDQDESYLAQLQKLVESIDNPNTIIGGDFNVRCGDSLYDQTIQLGLIDLYGLNVKRRFEPTHEDNLDVHKDSSRIDYIFATKQYEITDQNILFKRPKVSDHYGIYIEMLLVQEN